jgi:hypothetical protein
MDFTEIADYASGQDDVVARWELIDMGMRSRDIATALADDRLQHVHDTVYLVGDAELTWHGRCKAATLAVPEAIISHLTATMIHGIVPLDESRPIDLLVSDDPADCERLRREAFTMRADERAAIRERSARA